MPFSITVWPSAIAMVTLLVCGFSMRASERTTPIALYTFQEGGGTLVRDLSGSLPRLDLDILTPDAVSWLDGGGLRVDKPALIRSQMAADKISQACRRSQEIAVEAWVRPANTTQDGPARIVTLSSGTTARNFTLGQQGGAFEVRTRTRATSGNGLPRYRTADAVVETTLTHLVYVRDRHGTVSFHVNGKSVPLATVVGLDGVSTSSQELKGDFSNWADGFFLALAAEQDRARHWLGELHALAIYDRAMKPEEWSRSLADLRAGVPPVVSDLQPGFGVAFHPPDESVRFTVTTVASNRVDQSSIRVELNGRDVTGQLRTEPVEGGWRVAYQGLEPDRLYQGKATVADDQGRRMEMDLLFDTYPAWRHRTMNEAETVLVPLHHPMDFHLALEGELPAEPFMTEVLLIASGPRNVRLTIPGFYRGANVWCVRFSPTMEGEWRLQTLSSDPRLTAHSSRVLAGANPNPKVRGPLRVDRFNPLHFRLDDGSPFLLFGYEVDWLWAIDQTAEEPKRLHHFLDAVASAGFNYFIVNIYAHDTGWRQGHTRENDFGPPELFAWEGTNENPDHARMNPAFFDHYDRMMQAMHERGLTAHLMIKVYNKMVNWPARRSAEEDLYFDYVVSRYQAFPNVVWDFSKESYNEPDKRYIFDRLTRLRAMDAYNRLTTIHDDDRVTFDPQWNEVIDFVTDQNHSRFYDTILRQRAYGLGPVFNAEYGYEHGPEGLDDRTYGVAQPPLEVLMRTYEVLMAGGYPAYYYTNHAWDIIEWDEMPAGLPAYGHLYRFFNSFPWYALDPQPDYGRDGLYCLTDGVEHLVLFSRTGRGTLALPPDWESGAWSGQWMDIWTGEQRQATQTQFQSGRQNTIESPFANKPAVAHFRKH
jgi:hypothetical protein